MVEVSSQVIVDTTDGETLVVQVNMGTPGIRGIPGQTPDFVGPWDENTDYVALDVVEDGGSSWITPVDLTATGDPGHAPSLGSPGSLWILVAAAGIVGPAGPTGFSVLISDPGPLGFSLNELALAEQAAVLRIPSGFDGYAITVVAAAVSGVSSSGPVTINMTTFDGETILSTPITIDEGTFDSTVAAVQPVIDIAFADVNAGDQINFNVIDTGVNARGLIVELTIAPI